MIDPDMLEVFVEESKEHLDNLEPDLLSLENSPNDPEVINRIFRAVHSIKGTSGFFGLDNISGVGHVMESLMSLVRDGTVQITQPMLDALLEGTDKLRVMIDDPTSSADEDITDTVAKIKPFIGGNEQVAFAPGGEPMGDAPEGEEAPQAIELPDNLKIFTIYPQYFSEALSDKKNVYILRLFMQADINAKGMKPLGILEEIDSLGQMMDTALDFSEIGGVEDVLSADPKVCILFSTIMQPDLIAGSFDIPHSQIEEIELEAIERIANYGDVIQSESDIEDAKLKEEEARLVEIEEAVAEPVAAPEATSSNAAEPEVKKEAASIKKADETIRVSVSLLDDLMNLAGEMVLGRNQLIRLSTQVLGRTDGLSSVVQNISHITSDLQEKVMRTRLQPVGSILTKFHRIIRDLGKKLGKEIDLEIIGEEVELDKSILENLSDPLTHLIRNCADHAVEGPDERVANGKNRRGNVKIQASHVGGQVHINIVDDGRGIDAEKIKQKALEKEIITQEEAAAMTERHAMMLIFKPGFSSAEKVSDVSGRGVGMDVVKTNIEKIGGTVELDSELGSGTSICLRLPLTLAIVPAMIVESCARRFAVPQENLEEIVSLDAENKIEKIRDTEVLRLRQKLLPLVRLETLLDIESPEEEAKAYKSSNFDGFVLVLKIGDDSFGLIVDQLLESEEIVVKPLSSYLQTAPCYSGATIMGDGRVAMILDTAGVVDLANLNFSDGLEDEEDKRKLAYDLSETQSILLFKNGTNEQFAMNLQMVSRIEKVDVSEIEQVGDKEYIKYRNGSLRLLRLDHHMPISGPTEQPEHLHIIVPQLVTQPLGIIATEVVDAVPCSAKLDSDTLAGTGILGTTVLNSVMTIFVDVYSLFEEAAPDIYSKCKPQEDFSQKKILLAEDTAFFRAVELQYLGEFFDNVDVAVNGQEAWDMIKSHHYDMLVTDIEMPLLTGLELTKKVRADNQVKDIPIIALTSLSSDKSIDAGHRAGVDKYNVKLDKEALRESIEGLFSGRLASNRTDILQEVAS